jgi:hypothetical protein
MNGSHFKQLENHRLTSMNQVWSQLLESNFLKYTYLLKFETMTYFSRLLHHNQLLFHLTKYEDTYKR